MNIQSVKAAYGAQAYGPAKGVRKPAPEKPAATANEQVELSDTSLNLQKVREAADAAPEVRIKMVDELRTKIRYNGYPLESSLYKAVEKMVQNRII